MVTGSTRAPLTSSPAVRTATLTNRQHASTLRRVSLRSRTRRPLRTLYREDPEDARRLAVVILELDDHLPVHLLRVQAKRIRGRNVPVGGAGGPTLAAQIEVTMRLGVLRGRTLTRRLSH